MDEKVSSLLKRNGKLEIEADVLRSELSSLEEQGEMLVSDNKHFQQLAENLKQTRHCLEEELKTLCKQHVKATKEMENERSTALDVAAKCEAALSALKTPSCWTSIPTLYTDAGTCRKGFTRQPKRNSLEGRCAQLTEEWATARRALAVFEEEQGAVGQKARQELQELWQANQQLQERFRCLKDKHLKAEERYETLAQSSLAVKTRIMPLRLQCVACPILLSCLGFYLANAAAAARDQEEGTPVDVLKMLGALHGKMFDHKYMSLSQNTVPITIFAGTPATCTAIQLLYSEEETNSFGELWVYYKKLDGKRYIDTIGLTFTAAYESGLGNTFRFKFSESSQNGHTFKGAEFQVRRHSSCYSLKASLGNQCFIIALLTSSGASTPYDCVPRGMQTCQYETYKLSESVPCLEYEEVTDDNPTEAEEPNPESSDDKVPLHERHRLLQKYQDFPQGLLYGSLVLVYSSLEEDSSRLCMITYYPNRDPKPDGQLNILKTGSKKAITQAFEPRTATGHNATYRAEARIYRNDKFHGTRMIFTDQKRCTILRTPGYSNLCELFTGGRYNNGVVNSYCFFIYTVYCKTPAKVFTKLKDCWPYAGEV
ncbi:uncharacterized protein LOC120841076 [Ixodes scapularis]|uniref:uncharacterized protein LOC120841076 n=1 Tax=Ixodes scapularis TaxID=6945 RepID=UPI001A9E7174|nr:uncharacterized protein LOC120841076 [Ixodes scapularis]